MGQPVAHDAHRRVRPNTELPSFSCRHKGSVQGDWRKTGIVETLFASLVYLQVSPKYFPSYRDSTTRLFSDLHHADINNSKSR